MNRHSLAVRLPALAALVLALSLGLSLLLSYQLLVVLVAVLTLGIVGTFAARRVA